MVYSGHDQPPPPPPASHHQKSWDSCKMVATVNALIGSAPNAQSRAWLLAATSKEVGAWLYLPVYGWTMMQYASPLVYVWGPPFVDPTHAATVVWKLKTLVPMA